MAKSRELTNPDAPATFKQNQYIFRLGGGKAWEENLTREQAAAKIEKLLAAQSHKALEKHFPAGSTKRKKFHGGTMAAALLQAGVAPKNKTVEKPLGLNFSRVMREAVDAANAAGDKWWNEHSSVQPYNQKTCSSMQVGMLDFCGISEIELTDKRTKFAKWYIKTYCNTGVKFVNITHKFQTRQEKMLRDACHVAALMVFHKYNVDKGLVLFSRDD